MKKRVILVGKSGAGKDYARKIFENIIGGKYAVSYTTRPARESEVDGKDYHFIPVRTFNKMINEGLWYEWVEFNGWMYGTSKKQFYGDCFTFIMTPKGLSHLSKEDRDESCVIYFNIEESVRKVRMMERQGNADSVDRRIEADRIDFESYNDYDYIITNPEYRVDDMIEIARQIATKPIDVVQKTKNKYLI